MCDLESTWFCYMIYVTSIRKIHKYVKCIDENICYEMQEALVGK